ncbi:hypothetical protein D3C76_1425560 [compost metagenome]
MAQQCGDGGLLRRNRDINHAALDQIDISTALDQYHHLFGSHAFGQHGRHDIGFVIVGDGNKYIHLLDMLFGQQLLIGGIAIKHDGIVQLLC